MRIVHAADVHLETVYGVSRAEDAEALEASTRAAWSALVDVVLSERADALIVAGDLFDAERISWRTERLLYHSLSRLRDAGVDVVIAAGNHDPGEALSRRPWPAGVVLATSQTPVRHVVQRGHEAVGVVVAVGHEHARVSDNLAARFPSRRGTLPHVAVLHGQVDGAHRTETHARYAPCSPADLRTPEDGGYDYWALGHVHSAQWVHPRAAYSGCLQGRHTGERGAKGAWVVDLEGEQEPRGRFVSLARTRFERMTLNRLATVIDLAALRDVVMREWHGLSLDHVVGDERWRLQVRLSGDCPLASTLPLVWDDREEWLVETEAALCDALDVQAVSLDVSGWRVPTDVEPFIGQPHALGEALACARALASGDAWSAEWLEGWVGAPVGADETARKAYVRSLLDGVDEALVRRATRGP